MLIFLGIKVGFKVYESNFADRDVPKKCKYLTFFVITYILEFLCWLVNKIYNMI